MISNFVIEPPIFTAIANRDLVTIDKYLSSGKDPNLRTSNRTTIACFAAFKGYLDILVKLKKYKANFKLKGNKNNSLYLCAASGGQIKVIKWLRDNNQMNIKDTNDDGNTALLLSAACGQTETLWFLLKNNFAHISERNIHGDSAFLIAVYNGQTETAKWLLRNNYAHKDECDNHTNNSLLFTSCNNQLETLKWLLISNNLSENPVNAVTEKHINKFIADIIKSIQVYDRRDQAYSLLFELIPFLYNLGFIYIDTDKTIVKTTVSETILSHQRAISNIISYLPEQAICYGYTGNYFAYANFKRILNKTPADIFGIIKNYATIMPAKLLA